MSTDAHLHQAVEPCDRIRIIALSTRLQLGPRVQGASVSSEPGRPPPGERHAPRAVVARRTAKRDHPAAGGWRCLAPDDPDCAGKHFGGGR
jgi:hypothetical protein